MPLGTLIVCGDLSGLLQLDLRSAVAGAVSVPAIVSKRLK